jgi:hypothetical protein
MKNAGPSPAFFFASAGKVECANRGMGRSQASAEGTSPLCATRLARTKENRRACTGDFHLAMFLKCLSAL